MISVTGLEILIYSALALASLSPFVLIYFVIKDIREKKLW